MDNRINESSSDNESAGYREQCERLKLIRNYRTGAGEIIPPEIIELENYFSPVRPSYLGDGGLDGVRDKTDINWLYIQGYDIEKSISEYISFKPHVNAYKEMKLNYILWPFHYDATFFIIDSRECLPKDKATFEILRNTAIENSIRIVEEVSKGIFHDFVEEKYYRLEVDETWPGSADDAATYGAYHIKEITDKDALQ